jgi:hypothetical protein
MDHAGVVVEDLAAAMAFFVELRQCSSNFRGNGLCRSACSLLSDAYSVASGVISARVSWMASPWTSRK